MKIFFFAFSFMALPFCMSAQDNNSEDIISLEEQTKFRKNEIGIVGQVTFGYNNNYHPGGILIGANYKRRVKQNLTYRISGGYSPYQYYNQSDFTEIKNDTFYRNFTSVSLNSGFLGLGIEAQRKFFTKGFICMQH